MTLPFKIDCDALTQDDLETLAKLVVKVVPYFTGLISIPKGGDRLTQALKKYITPVGIAGRVWLVIDDVYTTGDSMRDTMSGIMSDWDADVDSVEGIVIFSRIPRSKMSHNVRALFYLDQLAGP